VECDSLLDEASRNEISKLVAERPVVMYGWESCPCVATARTRFMSKHVCFVENTWLDPEDPKMAYLQCVYGSEHHSFIWFNDKQADGSMAGGNFIGNGFALGPTKMSDATFEGLVAKSGASQECQGLEEENLQGGELESCSDASDVTTTGFTRSGSCVWQANDGGYHQVCVKMSNEFLDVSANVDKNDLSSVVSEGGHWCICAWAWASAVQRDPVNYEGITLECGRTNARLRQVYQMHVDQNKDLCSPGGICYKAKQALDAVNALCPEETGLSLTKAKEYPLNQPQETDKPREVVFFASSLYATYGLVAFIIATIIAFAYSFRSRCTKRREQSIPLDYTFDRLYWLTRISLLDILTSSFFENSLILGNREKFRMDTF